VTASLAAADLERVLSVVESCERADDLESYRATTLAALASSVGFRRSTFFLTGPPEPLTTGTDGVQLGFRRSTMEHYVERHRDDPFRADPAVRILRRDGLVSLDQLAGWLRPSEHDYVERFLGPNTIRSQLCLWLDTDASTHGVVCILGDDEAAFDDRDRAILLALRPHLANLLALHLPSAPPGLTAQLSEREQEVVALLAEGHTNAEIARALGISEDTVKKHVSRALAACRVRNRTELTLRWRAS
jgi:DNA-binding CsgD family transcriptional regulator